MEEQNTCKNKSYVVKNIDGGTKYLKYKSYVVKNIDGGTKYLQEQVVFC